MQNMLVNVTNEIYYYTFLLKKMTSFPEEVFIQPTERPESPIITSIISAVIFTAGAGNRLESSQHPVHTLHVHTHTHTSAPQPSVNMCVRARFMRLNQSNSHPMMFETQRLVVCSCALSYMSVSSPDGCFHFVWSLFALFTKLKPRSPLRTQCLFKLNSNQTFKGSHYQSVS